MATASAVAAVLSIGALAAAAKWREPSKTKIVTPPPAQARSTNASHATVKGKGARNVVVPPLVVSPPPAPATALGGGGPKATALPKAPKSARSKTVSFAPNATTTTSAAAEIVGHRMDRSDPPPPLPSLMRPLQPRLDTASEPPPTNAGASLPADDFYASSFSTATATRPDDRTNPPNTEQERAMSQLPPHLRQYVDPTYRATAPSTVPGAAGTTPRPEYDYRRTDMAGRVIGATAQGGALAWSDDRRAAADRYEYIDQPPQPKLQRTFGSVDDATRVHVEGNTSHHPTGRAARSYPVIGREADSFLRRQTGSDPHRRARSATMNPTLFPEVEQHVAFEGQKFMSDRERDMASALNPDTIGDYMLPFVRPDIRQWTPRPVSYKKPTPAVREALMPDTRAGVNYQANNIGGRVTTDEEALPSACGLPGDHHNLFMAQQLPRDKPMNAALRRPLSVEPARTVVPDEDIPIPKELAPATYTLVRRVNKKLQQPESLAYGATYGGGQDTEDGAGMDLPHALTTINLESDRRPHAHRVPVTAGSATSQHHGAAPAPETDRGSVALAGGETELRRLATGGPLRKEQRAVYEHDAASLVRGVHVGSVGADTEGDGPLDGVATGVGRARSADPTVRQAGGGFAGREQRMTTSAAVQLQTATLGGDEHEDGVSVPRLSAKAERTEAVARQREHNAVVDLQRRAGELDDQMGAAQDRTLVSAPPREHAVRAERREAAQGDRYQAQLQVAARVGDALDDGTGTTFGDHHATVATVDAGAEQRHVLAGHRETQSTGAAAAAGRRILVDENHEDAGRSGAQPMALAADVVRGPQRAAQREAVVVGSGPIQPTLLDERLQTDSHVLNDYTSTQAHRTEQQGRVEGREQTSQPRLGQRTHELDEERMADTSAAQHHTIAAGAPRLDQRAERAESLQTRGATEREQRQQNLASASGLTEDGESLVPSVDRTVGTTAARAERLEARGAQRESDMHQRSADGVVRARVTDERVSEADTHQSTSVRARSGDVREGQRVTMQARADVVSRVGDPDSDRVEDTLGHRGEHVGALSRTTLAYGGRSDALTWRERQSTVAADATRRGVHIGEVDAQDGDEFGVMDGRGPLGTTSSELAGRTVRREQVMAAAPARHAADAVGEHTIDDEDWHLRSAVGVETREAKHDEHERRRLDVVDQRRAVRGFTIGDGGGDDDGAADRPENQPGNITRASLRELYRRRGAVREGHLQTAHLQRGFTDMSGNSDGGGPSIDASHVLEHSMTTSKHRPDRAWREETHLVPRHSNAEGDFMSAAVFEGPGAGGVRDRPEERFMMRETRQALVAGHLDDLHSHMTGHVDPHTHRVYKPVVEAKQEQRELALHERMRSESPPPAAVLLSHPRFRAMNAGGMYNVNHANHTAGISPPASPRRPASPIFRGTRVMVDSK